MPSITTYHLQLPAGLHIGQRGIGQEETEIYVPSDTLFSAIVSTWVKMGLPASDWEPFAAESGDPPFLLTSAFPRAGGVRLYPMPALWLGDRIGRPGVDIKKLRRIKYVSESILRQILSGAALQDVYPSEQENGGGLFLNDSRVWISREEKSLLPKEIKSFTNLRGQDEERPDRALNLIRLWEAVKVPRVTVQRVRQSGEIFHTGRVVFHAGCGLWLGVVWRRPDDPITPDRPTWRSGFEHLLHVLGDEGIGGERSAGYGAFTWSAGAVVHWPDPHAGQPFVTMSRYHPGADEISQVFNGPLVSYQLVSVGGFLHSPQAASQRRLRKWLIAEGSILTFVGKPVTGAVPDVRPLGRGFPHPVWRYGLATPIALEVPNA